MSFREVNENDILKEWLNAREEGLLGYLTEEDKEHQRILCELIRTLYKTVPLYSLKGHTRTEVEEESQEARFHVIQGGKE